MIDCIKAELLDAWHHIRHWCSPYYLTSKNTSTWDSEYMSFVIAKRKGSAFYGS